MEKCKVKIYNASKYPLPEYQSSGAAGVDLYADIDEPDYLHNSDGNLSRTAAGIRSSDPGAFGSGHEARHCLGQWDWYH